MFAIYASGVDLNDSRQVLEASLLLPDGLGIISHSDKNLQTVSGQGRAGHGGLDRRMVGRSCSVGRVSDIGAVGRVDAQTEGRTVERTVGLSSQRTGAHSSTIALGDLNAKLFHRTPADEDIIGQYLFESQLRKEMAQTNRELLLEVCRAMRCCVANTFFEHTPENLVTFRTLGTTPQAAITTATFSQIDHCLVPHAMLDNVADIWSDRGASLQTQHYILQVFMRLSFARCERRASERGCDVRRLMSDLSWRNSFGALFCEQMQSATAAENLDQQATNVEDAMRVASSVAVRTGRMARRPWISQRTLDLIEQREESREQGWAHVGWLIVGRRRP